MLYLNIMSFKLPTPIKTKRLTTCTANFTNQYMRRHGHSIHDNIIISLAFLQGIVTITFALVAVPNPIPLCQTMLCVDIANGLILVFLALLYVVRQDELIGTPSYTWGYFVVMTFKDCYAYTVCSYSIPTMFLVVMYVQLGSMCAFISFLIWYELSTNDLEEVHHSALLEDLI